MSTNLPYTTTYNIEGLTNGNTTIEFTSSETTNYLSKKKTIDIVSSVEGSSSDIAGEFEAFYYTSNSTDLDSGYLLNYGYHSGDVLSKGSTYKIAFFENKDTYNEVGIMQINSISYLYYTSMGYYYGHMDISCYDHIEGNHNNNKILFRPSIGFNCYTADDGDCPFYITFNIERL